MAQWSWTTKRMQSYVNQKANLSRQKRRDANEKQKGTRVRAAIKESRAATGGTWRSVVDLINHLWPSMERRTGPKRIQRLGVRKAVEKSS